MSSTESKPEVLVDTVVLAGIRGTRLLQIGDAPVGKPYLELGGEPLVRRVVRAVLGAARVGRVFVVGDPQLLAAALEPLLASSQDRLRIVPEGGDILDNCYRAFFLNLLPACGHLSMGSERLDEAVVAEYRVKHPETRLVQALFLVSDLPFLAPGDLDRFLERAPEDAALTLGLVDHRGLQRMRVDLGEQTGLDEWKLGALHLRQRSVRINNLFLVRPLMVEPALYSALNELYAHRWLLRQDGSLNWENWWALGRAILGYTRRLKRRLRFWRGMLNFVPELVCMGLARLTHRVGRWLSWPFRQFVGQRDLEFVGSLLAGVKLRLVISEDLGPAIDVDVEESYLNLVREGEENFRRVARYLGRLEKPAAAGKSEFKVVAGGRR